MAKTKFVIVEDHGDKLYILVHGEVMIIDKFGKKIENGFVEVEYGIEENGDYTLYDEIIQNEPIIN